jgi:hypothetical protein
MHNQATGDGLSLSKKGQCVCCMLLQELDHDEICVVNGGNEASSSIGANLSSKEVKEKLTRLQLVDNATHQMKIVQQRIISVDWVPVCFTT